MSLLEQINDAADVKKLPVTDLPRLAAELRTTILDTVSKNGGHLASNLGTVELTIALLRTFTPPQDQVVWDVGHQTYSWKILTGRREQFASLRQHGGLSGFPKPHESPYDAFVGGHAGTALSAALGIATARDQTGRQGHVIAILGDGSLTNGIALEALNSIAETTSKLIVILNDNKMSISENVGALSRRLGRMLANARYNRIKAAAEAAGHRMRMTPLRRTYHRLERAIKSLWLRNAMFEEFGLRYVGPIDGHDFNALNNALASACDAKRSVVLHIATQKGRGYTPAERDPRHWHGVGKFEIKAPQPPAHPSLGYSQAMGHALSALAHTHPEIVAITAAMPAGTGLDIFAQHHPRRFFDVGISESHAMVFAAGLAIAGLKPVFAVYSTFLQRAIDCVMHDICLQRLPVVLCVDRAGVVGSDGPTHHGVFDIPMLRALPHLVMMQPRDLRELEAMLTFALALKAPVTIRYPRDPAPPTDAQPMPPLALGQAEIVQPPGTPTAPLWIWALGDMVPMACEIAAHLAHNGQAVGVVNARFIKPLDSALLCLQAQTARAFITLENGVIAGGFGSAVAETLSAHGHNLPVWKYGWPDEFVSQGNLQELRHDHGLTVSSITAAINGHLAQVPD